jgi:isoleucyl-tRNA synthetase
MAPGFGEDDQRVCEANGIALVVPVDDRGRFTAEVTDWAGTNVFDANKDIIKVPSRSAASLLRHDLRPQLPALLAHREPLIYKAVSSWFVEVTAFKDRMVELNQEITWIPEHVKRRPVRQVARERPRLVDLAQPLLGHADPGVAQRRPEVPAHRRLRLARRARARLRRAVTDLHRPFIDELVRPTPTTRPASR